MAQAGKVSSSLDKFLVSLESAFRRLVVRSVVKRERAANGRGSRTGDHPGPWEHSDDNERMPVEMLGQTFRNYEPKR